MFALNSIVNLFCLQKQGKKFKVNDILLVENLTLDMLDTLRTIVVVTEGNLSKLGDNSG